MRHTRHIRYNVNVLVPQNPHTHRGGMENEHLMSVVYLHTHIVYF